MEFYKKVAFKIRTLEELIENECQLQPGCAHNRWVQWCERKIWNNKLIYNTLLAQLGSDHRALDDSHQLKFVAQDICAFEEVLNRIKTKNWAQFVGPIAA